MERMPESLSRMCAEALANPLLAGILSSIVATVLVALGKVLWTTVRRWWFRSGSRSPCSESTTTEAVADLNTAPLDSALGGGPESTKRDVVVRLRYIFEELTQLGKTLERLESDARTGAREFKGAAVVIYTILALLVGLFLTAKIPLWVLISTNLVMNYVLALFMIYVDYGPYPCPIVLFELAFFPLSPILLLARLLSRIHGADSARVKIITDCRWHLLFAIPSTNSARRTLERKREHIAHLEAIAEALDGLSDDPFTFVRLSKLASDSRILAREMAEELPDTCESILTLGIPVLRQITLVDVADSKEEG